MHTPAQKSIVLVVWLVLLAGPLASRAQDAKEEKNASAETDPKADVAGNAQVADIIKTFEGRGAMADDTPPTPPEEAVKQFKVREGFEIELMASEPVIGQPLFASWDSRGRMWVVQYLQYQFPAGLKILEYDNHLRAVFDKVPEAPPNHVKGADKITVFTDTDGDGKFDEHQDVITGLNITSSVVTGHGGIWVMNPPYLLYYPDADGDGVPDGDPEVCLSGFGLEDTHSVANSLHWGPDGWLYGVNGSTTTGRVSSAVTKDVAWQGQNVWRYHPDTKVFEIYAEGGGNTFSLNIDEKGRVFSGTNNGDTRGMYYPQGSYGKKSWGKHGPLTNPYSFGYFQHMRHEGDNRRFAQAFCIYEGGLFPKEYEGKIIAPNSLQNVVWVSERLPDTSTYRTVDEENLVESSDRWFRPVFAGVGPDGAVYITDWYDTRLSHVSPVDDWHKESGRIYRVKPKGADVSMKPFDLGAAPTAELVALLDHPNRWMRRRAVLELGWRGDQAPTPELVEMVKANSGQKSLEALWALNLLGGLTDELAIQWLSHEDEHVRRWVVRLIGDAREASPNVGDALSELAAREEAVQVRSQLASAAKRLPAGIGLAIVQNLLAWEEDLEDLHMPLMDWWAMEAHAEDGRERVLAMMKEGSIWNQPLFRKEIASRLMRRYAMAGGEENYEMCARLLELAPDAEVSKQLMTGLQEAFQGVTISDLPPSLTQAMDDYAKSVGESDLVLGIRQGKKEALKEAIKVVQSDGSDLAQRIELVKLFGQIDDPTVVKPLLGLLGLDRNSPLKRVALQALANYDDPNIPKTILGRYGSTLPAEHHVRSTADRVMAGRLEWARQYLKEIDAWHIKAADISPDVVQLLKQHHDPEINALVAKHWPEMRAMPSEAKLAEVRRLREVLKGEPGNAENGKLLFAKRCAVCHSLFGEGGVIGPELTGYERGNLDFWLPAIVDPSLEIREGFANYVVRMKDGRALIGMMAAQDQKTVTLRDAANQTTVLNLDQVDTLEATPVSLMPEGLLLGLSDGDVRDLFAYLTKDAK